MDEAGPGEEKAALRGIVRARRGALAPALREQATRRAGEHLLGLPELRAADRVLLYAGHGDELSTDRVLTALVARGVEVLLPRVAGDDLELVAFASVDGLRPGFRGVREPTGPAIDPHELQVAVVPGVAFDRDGGRLGQGGGHYDRLLSRLDDGTLRVGLAFALQVVDRVPTQPHDQRVHVVVTEEGVARPVAG